MWIDKISYWMPMSIMVRCVDAFVARRNRRLGVDVAPFVPYSPPTLREIAKQALHSAEAEFDRTDEEFEFFNRIASKIAHAIHSGDYSRE